MDNLQFTISVRFFHSNIEISCMTEVELKFRLKQFALMVIRLVDEMPYSVSSKALANQIMRSGTSPYANYCAACIAKSDKDFINKLKMVEEELNNSKCKIKTIVNVSTGNNCKIEQ